MSIFGKLVVGALSKNHPEQLAYHRHSKGCSWFRKCTCALDQYMGRASHTEPLRYQPKTTNRLPVIYGLLVVLWWTAFFYKLAHG